MAAEAEGGIRQGDLAWLKENAEKLHVTYSAAKDDRLDLVFTATDKMSAYEEGKFLLRVTYGADKVSYTCESPVFHPNIAYKELGLKQLQAAKRPRMQHVLKPLLALLQNPVVDNESEEAEVLNNIAARLMQHDKTEFGYKARKAINKAAEQLGD